MFELIDQDKLKQCLDKFTIEILDEIDSTNSYLLNQETLDRKLVIAEKQTQGRGRKFGRTWESTPGCDVTLSLGWIFAAEFNVALLGIIVAIAANRAYQKQGLNTQIKWPNDVMGEDGVKIAGILIEGRYRQAQHQMVIGIGLDNVKKINRTDFVIEVINQIELVIKQYNELGFEYVRLQWLGSCIHWHNKVELIKDSTTIDQVIHTDLSERGELVVRDSLNKLHTYSSNDISVRY